MKFKIKENPFCGWYIFNGNGNYLWMDLKLHMGTGWCESNKKYGQAVGYYPSKEIAQAYLNKYLAIQPSDAVEVVEEFIVKLKDLIDCLEREIK